MTVKTYKCTAEQNRVDKTPYLTNEQTLSNTVKMEGSQNVEAPELIINSTTMPTFTYCYIQDFNRWYYASVPVWVSNNVWSVSLAVDVLMTYKDAILNKRAILNRLEDKNGWGMIIDDRIVAETTQNSDVTFTNLTPYEPTEAETEAGYVYAQFDVQDQIGGGTSIGDHVVISTMSGYTGTGTDEIVTPMTSCVDKNDKCTWSTEFSPYTLSYELTTREASTTQITFKITIFSAIYNPATILVTINGVTSEYSVNLTPTHTFAAIAGTWGGEYTVTLDTSRTINEVQFRTHKPWNKHDNTYTFNIRQGG